MMKKKLSWKVVLEKREKELANKKIKRLKSDFCACEMVSPSHIYKPAKRYDTCRAEEENISQIASDKEEENIIQIASDKD
ncbi:hypothetical protein VNO77_24481 [Canavalia gladiata]|uniref:Uncharacterized protein n=1 Tax=Canavalia gladiata TaxID=3824 RepID=A0AAN9QCK0_CANGL